MKNHSSPENVRKKRELRAKRSNIKHKIRNCEYESWITREKHLSRLRLVKYPHYKVTLSNTKGTKRRVTIMAPSIIDYYKKGNHNTTNRFLTELTDCCKTHGRKVFIDFKNTEKITAAAMLSFLAQVDVLIQTNKTNTSKPISFNHPQNEKIESILKQVGLYELVGKPIRDTKSYDDVTYWNYCSDSCSQPMIAKPMLENIANRLKNADGTASKKLYRGFVEAMSNSVEHAYKGSGTNCTNSDTDKWWTFAGIRDNKLAVVICDKGVGIPATLPKTQGVNALSKWFLDRGYHLHKLSDSKYIKAATELTKTSTGQKHRGKGLSDILSVINSIGKGSLLIYSNKGELRYRCSGQSIQDYKYSVGGTIIEWTIPLN